MERNVNPSRLNLGLQACNYVGKKIPFKRGRLPPLYYVARGRQLARTQPAMENTSVSPWRRELLTVVGEVLRRTCHEKGCVLAHASRINRNKHRVEKLKFGLTTRGIDHQSGATQAGWRTEILERRKSAGKRKGKIRKSKNTTIGGRKGDLNMFPHFVSCNSHLFIAAAWGHGDSPASAIKEGGHEIGILSGDGVAVGSHEGRCPTPEE